ncbi:hypothetical protein ACFP3I_05250 [Chryseobacterium arachidis]|uniref:hypothetical protein n=1 Tax=Chryseobacterium arachidis TaxID=1416778 RepID=UPI0009322E32
MRYISKIEEIQLGNDMIILQSFLHSLESNPSIAEDFYFVNLCYSSPEMYYLFSRNASTFGLSKSSKINLK